MPFQAVFSGANDELKGAALFATVAAVEATPNLTGAKRVRIITPPTVHNSLKVETFNDTDDHSPIDS